MPASIDLGPCVTRNQLYDLVWTHETKALAARLNLSGSLIGRLCRRWDIPKPSRGEWQQMQAGQAVRRPPLPRWSGTQADPEVLHMGGSGGYGTSVPRKDRRRRQEKPDILNDLREKLAQEDQHVQRRRDELIAFLDHGADRHVLAVEDWSIDYHLEVGVIGEAMMLDDIPSLRLACRYQQPERRRGVLVHAEVGLHRPGNHEGEVGRGNVRYSKRAISFTIDEARIALVCSALAAGRIRALELETVGGPAGSEIIRRAKLCTQVEPEPTSGQKPKDQRPEKF